MNPVSNQRLGNLFSRNFSLVWSSTLVTFDHKEFTSSEFWLAYQVVKWLMGMFKCSYLGKGQNEKSQVKELANMNVGWTQNPTEKQPRTKNV